jgi:hypothetical protein
MKKRLAVVSVMPIIVPRNFEAEPSSHSQRKIISHLKAPLKVFQSVLDSAVIGRWFSPAIFEKQPFRAVRSEYNIKLEARVAATFGIRFSKVCKFMLRSLAI